MGVNSSLDRSDFKSDPLPIGTVVKPWGPICAIGNLNGERYYWFSKGRGDVSMMPAVVVEGKCLRP